MTQRTLVALLAAVSLAVGTAALPDRPWFCHDLECPDFKVLRDLGNGIELRAYGPTTWARTTVRESSLDKATIAGFNVSSLWCS
jgi:hypothetical protein